MQDEQIRELERLAAQGDREAFWKLATELARLGDYDRLGKLHDSRYEVVVWEMERCEDLKRRGFLKIERLFKGERAEDWSVTTGIEAELLVSIPCEIKNIGMAQAVVSRVDGGAAAPSWVIVPVGMPEVMVYGQKYRWPLLARLSGAFRGETRFVITEGHAVVQGPAVAAPAPPEPVQEFLGVENDKWHDFFAVLHDGAFNGSEVVYLADHLCREYDDCLSALGRDVLTATPERIHDALGGETNLLPSPVREHASGFVRVLGTPAIRLWLGELLVIIRNRRGYAWASQPGPLGQLRCMDCDRRYDDLGGLHEHRARVHHIAPDGSPVP